ncbi:MAG: peptidylprolyl isomerase, partial [Ruminococcus sp.]|nr:peptidylprolyl isomerase [Ruminococcus sp.]
MAAAGLTSCGKEIKVEDSGSEASKVPETSHDIDISRFSDRTAPQFDAAASDIKNFSPLEKGEQIVVMSIRGYGDVKIRLFPEYASKGVENFVELAKQGYYDGLTFHRVISDFMIQGGDPEGTGSGGHSIWGEKFDGGTDEHLIHAAGAVAYANSGSTATNGSQFYVVTGTVYSADDLD